MKSRQLEKVKEKGEKKDKERKKHNKKERKWNEERNIERGKIVREKQYFFNQKLKKQFFLELQFSGLQK